VRSGIESGDATAVSVASGASVGEDTVAFDSDVTAADEVASHVGDFEGSDDDDRRAIGQPYSWGRFDARAASC
jgi:hypothetical protein